MALRFPDSWEEQNSGIVVHSEFPWQIIVLTINACEYEVPDGTEVSCYSEEDVRNTMAERAVWRMVEHYHSHILGHDSVTKTVGVELPDTHHTLSLAAFHVLLWVMVQHTM